MEQLMGVLRAFVRRFLVWIDRRAQGPLATSPRWAALYFALFDGAFSREMAAVMAGRSSYQEATSSSADSYALLRRNVHRLEKGLIMRPRRPSFAADYIGETVEVFARSVGAETGPLSDEQRWARDVLREYFAAVSADAPAIAAARTSFEAAEAGIEVGTDTAGDRLVPFKRVVPDSPVVDFGDLRQLSMQRRSVRWFLPLPVPRPLLEEAFEVALQAPSACNRQAFQFLVFDEPSRAQEVAAVAMGTKGFADNLQSLIVVVGELSAYPEIRDRHVIYIDASLATMSLMFALETRGVATCSINWPDIRREEERMREVIDLGPSQRIVMLLAYGWPDPDGLVPRSVKVPISQAVRYE